MRVLVAQIPLQRNRFLVDLNTALEQHCELTHNSEAFWQMSGAYDVVHLHFPEYLTYEIEQAYHQGLTEELIVATEERLRWWAGRAKLVVTRHVLLPHDALESPMWEKMYAMFYRYADGVAHFAQASIDEFRQRYAGTKWFHGREPWHAIIPHHNYSSLPNACGREKSRRQLGIPHDAQVMLVFGAIRHEAEKQLILQTFHGLHEARKLLLVSSWHEELARVSWIRLKYWLRDLTRLYYRWHPSYRFHYGFVAETEAQLYLNAADILFIPRLWVLNSGNVTLGMTFGRVIVGPDSWDVGELLRETGNPVFDPDQPDTAVPAVAKGFHLAREGKIGPANQILALQEWEVAKCALQYVELFHRTIERARA